MAADVERDPVKLRRHAAEAHDVADELHSALSHMPGLDDYVDAERTVVAIRRAVAELRALAADLAGAAAVEHADTDARAALSRARLS
jgi:hypothetical protein